MKSLVCLFVADGVWIEDEHAETGKKTKTWTGAIKVVCSLYYNDHEFSDGWNKIQK